MYTVEDCRRSCDTEQEFQCRAFSFHSYRRDCLLSADDTHSTTQALIPDPDFFFGERGSCNNGKIALHNPFLMNFKYFPTTKAD